MAKFIKVEKERVAVVPIPGGTFTMGSPADEPERYSDEGPQHEVTVPSFFMGTYPVTQAQWRWVAGIPKVKIWLEPDPSRFKGDSLPVERVSWDEAVEFCDRLSQYTGLRYCLPTEAEWEYACRAGTETPFHCGATITTDLANYDGNYTYGSGPKGQYRKQTTEVGSFPANAFGLYDMHGNVWEWCQDVWYDRHPGNYEGAPTDGSAWLKSGDEERRILRGGSWTDYPWNCRSAYRNYYGPGIRFLTVGFRVVVEASLGEDLPFEFEVEVVG